MWRRVDVAAGCALLALTALPAAAQTTLSWSPSTDLYAPYVADPRRSRHIIGLMRVVDSDLPDSQNLRWGLSIGGTYGIARLTPAAHPEHAWQFDVEARFYAQFDIHYALDEIGHDGRLRVALVRGITPDVATRFTFVHTSSHAGDEYLIRNHLTDRSNSRREEVGAGVSWTISPRFRTYGDFGYGINLGPENRPIRLQSGIEFEDEPRLGNGRLYAALDVTSFEENGYQTSKNLQAGILFQSAGSDRQYRFGVELYKGRAQLDNFFLDHERYVIVGMWLDL